MKKKGLINIIYVISMIVLFVSWNNVFAAKTCDYVLPNNWNLLINYDGIILKYKGETIDIMNSSAQEYKQDATNISTTPSLFADIMKDSEKSSTSCPEIYLFHSTSAEGTCSDVNCFYLTKEALNPGGATKIIPKEYDHAVPDGNNKDQIKKCEEYETSQNKKELNTLFSELQKSFDEMKTCADKKCTPADFELKEKAYRAKEAEFTKSKKNVQNIYKGCTEAEYNIQQMKEYQDGLIKEVEDIIKHYGEYINKNPAISKTDKDKTSELLSNLLANFKDTAYNGSAGGNLGTTVGVDCSTYQGLMKLVSQFYGWIQIIAPILLIVFGSMDFAKAVLSNDQDALKKATSSIVKRAAATIMIFFLPLIVNWLFSLESVSSVIEGTFCEIIIN